MEAFAELADFLLERVGRAAEAAWRQREPARVGWAMTHAVTGLNRRAAYFGGTAVMYGDTALTNFSTWRVASMRPWISWGSGRPMNGAGVVVNVACPSQETENLNEISADFSHETCAVNSAAGTAPACRPAPMRPGWRSLAAPDPTVSVRSRSWINAAAFRGARPSPAGSPRPWTKASPGGDRGFRPAPLPRHAVVLADLPEAQPAVPPFSKPIPVHPQLHVLRLGEVAMATNPFELFHDYATHIEARSPAALTMLRFSSRAVPVATCPQNARLGGAAARTSSSSVPRAGRRW